MILVAYRHGLRVSELVDLRWDQVDFDHARAACPQGQAGHARRPIRFSGDEMRALRKLQREQEPKSPFVFTSERGSPFSTSGFAKLVERAGEAAGLGFPAHPHMLRHACGFALANKGHDTRACRRIWGTRTSSTPCGTPSFRRLGSRISGSRAAPSGAVHRLSFRRSGRDALLERDQNPPGIPGQEEPSLGRNGSGRFRLRRWLREY